jgi:hypothetical protein
MKIEPAEAEATSPLAESPESKSAGHPGKDKNAAGFIKPKAP